MIQYEPFRSLMDGKVLVAVQKAVEGPMGMWGFMSLAMAGVTVAYIKTESMLLTSFMWFIVLIGMSHIYGFERAPVFVVMLVFFIALAVFDIFIRDKVGG